MAPLCPSIGQAVYVADVGAGAASHNVRYDNLRVVSIIRHLHRLLSHVYGLAHLTQDLDNDVDQGRRKLLRLRCLASVQIAFEPIGQGNSPHSRSNKGWIGALTVAHNMSVLLCKVLICKACLV